MPEEKKKRGRPRLTDEEREERRIRNNEKQKEKRRIQKEQGYKPYRYTPPPSKKGQNKNGGIGGQEPSILRIAELMTMGLRVERVDVKDPEALIHRAEGYIEYCKQNSLVPMMSGLYVAMGINKQYFDELVTGSERVHSSQAVRDTLTVIKTVIAAGFQAAAANQEVAPPVAVLVMTNEQGYLDTKKIEHHKEINVQVEAISEFQDMANRYGIKAMTASDNVIETDYTDVPAPEPVTIELEESKK